MDNQNERVIFNAWKESSGFYDRKPSVLADMFIAWQARAARASSPSRPDGWVLVPVELPYGMANAMEQRQTEGATPPGEIEYALWQEVWKAALAAAPALGEPKKDEQMTNVERDIAAVLNRHCMENESNTPDFILAQYLRACLAAFTTATQQRETWYGRDARPSLPIGELEEPALGEG